MPKTLLFKTLVKVVKTEECSKKALFCGDFCDRNQAIILLVLVLVSDIYIVKCFSFCI